MKIKTRFNITVVLFSGIIAGVLIFLATTDNHVKKTSEQDELAKNISQGAIELSYLANDYLIHREDRQIERWRASFARFSARIAGLRPETANEKLLVKNMVASVRQLEMTFNDVLSGVQKSRTNQGDDYLFSELFSVSSSRLAVQTQGLFSDSQRLSRQIRSRLDRLANIRTFLVYAILFLFAIFLLANYILTYRRTMRSVAALRAGMKIIGEGDLDYKMKREWDDELGEVAEAVNQTTAELKKVTASKTELQKEIIERKQAEEAVRKSEEKYRLLFENMTEMFQILEPIFGNKGTATDFRYVEINRASERLVGKTRKEIEGKRAKELWGIVEEYWLEMLEKVLKTGEPVHMENYSRELNKYYDLYAWKANESRVAIIFSDISERKRAEEALRITADELAATNKELESFSYSVSHDLRAPLRAIKSFSDILLEDYSDILNQDGADLLKRIGTSTNRMSAIIDDMLSLAKISRESMNSQEIDLRSIADAVVNDLRESEPERTVEITIARALPAFADARLMHIALMNLIGNAWKYTGKNPTACLDIGMMTKENENVFFIQDNGAGFDMSLAHKLFQPFHRLHTDSQFSGTGIGLAIVNKIVQRHGGRIWAESEIGKGSTFYFILAGPGGSKR